MNTIVVESSIYNGALNYARKHKTSVDELVRLYLYQLGTDAVSYDSSSIEPSVDNSQYYISPRIKAMETGYKCADDLSTDYKKEIGAYRIKKYL